MLIFLNLCSYCLCMCLYMCICMCVCKRQRKREYFCKHGFLFVCFLFILVYRSRRDTVQVSGRPCSRSMRAAYGITLSSQKHRQSWQWNSGYKALKFVPNNENFLAIKDSPPIKGSIFIAKSFAPQRSSVQSNDPMKGVLYTIYNILLFHCACQRVEKL